MRQMLIVLNQLDRNVSLRPDGMLLAVGDDQKELAMLKITIRQEARSTRLTLEGRLAGPWVEELERVWRGIKDSAKDSLVVDLTGVTFIEQEGKSLLSKMWQEGAELVAAGCCSRSVLEDITSSGRCFPSNRIGKSHSR